jgi:hypothetical protein
VLLPLSLLEETDPVTWAQQYDFSPSILPSWPSDPFTALVGIIKRCTACGTSLGAYVILRPEDADDMYSEEQNPVLFFAIPRSVLLADPELCPGLTLESWSKE